MNKYIACCGLDCETCEARIATINNDDKLREKVAKEWSILNNIEIKKDDINCVGCNVEGVHTPFCSSLCPIRNCCKNNKYNTCIECKNFMSCERIKMIIDHNDKALDNLKNNQ